MGKTRFFKTRFEHFQNGVSNLERPTKRFFKFQNAYQVKNSFQDFFSFSIFKTIFVYFQFQPDFSVFKIKIILSTSFKFKWDHSDRKTEIRENRKHGERKSVVHFNVTKKL